jgi:undecaprenyl-phosphate 4-deoxy-4-formamido-L-arabinose transferase
MNPDLSIIIPVYNSSAILTELHRQLKAALSGKYSYEIIFVNDGSLDDSWSRIRTLCSSEPFIIAANLRKNSGQDNALIAGLRISKGEYVVIMDDDLQHSPSDIPALLEACRKGLDVCYASFDSKKHSRIKNIGSDINGKVATVLASKPKDIYLSPFKIINKATVQELVKFPGPYPYIDGIILSITSNIGQVAVDHRERHSGKGNYTFARSASVFMKMFTGFSVLPLRIATFTGCIATLIGIVLAVKYLYDYFIAKNFIEGWTTVVILIIFFGGLILITLGIVGEYIGRMYLAINNKPQYSISEIIKSDDQKA